MEKATGILADQRTKRSAPIQKDMIVKVNYLGFFPLGDEATISSVHFLKCPWKSINGLVIPIGKKKVVSPIFCYLFCAVENDEAVFFFAFEYGLAHYHIYIPNDKSKSRLERRFSTAIKELKTLYRGFSYNRIVEFMRDKYLHGDKAFISEDGKRRAVITLKEDSSVEVVFERLNIYSPEETIHASFPGCWLEEGPHTSCYDSMDRAINDLGLNSPKWEELNFK